MACGKTVECHEMSLKNSIEKWLQRGDEALHPTAMASLIDSVWRIGSLTENREQSRLFDGTAGLFYECTGFVQWSPVTHWVPPVFEGREVDTWIEKVDIKLWHNLLGISGGGGGGREGVGIWSKLTFGTYKYCVAPFNLKKNVKKIIIV